MACERLVARGLQDRGIGVAGILVVAMFATSAIAHDPPRTKVTWNGDIARIVNARCIRCHSPEGEGPMSLVTYEDARPWAKAIREEVLARRMPKWHAARGYGQFLNDPTLTPFEIALFISWVDGGALRGTEPVKLNPGGFAPPDPPSPSLAGTPSPRSAPAGRAPGAPADPLHRPPVQIQERRVTLPCKARTIPAGHLLGITPSLAENASAGIVVDFPDKRREILGWFRNYEAAFQETYWLETPLKVPAGSRLTVEGTPPCSLTLHMQR